MRGGAAPHPLRSFPLRGAAPPVHPSGASRQTWLLLPEVGASPPGASRQTWLLPPPGRRSAPPPRGPLRDSSPCTHQEGAPPLHPGGLCGTIVPAPTRRALRPSTPGDFRFTTKVTKGVSGGTPLNPLGGHYHPPSSASAAPPRRTLPSSLRANQWLELPSAPENAAGLFIRKQYR